MPDRDTRSWLETEYAQRIQDSVRALALPASSPFDWNCGSTIAAWDALANPRRPLLTARSEPQLAAAGICDIAATAGYRRLENQLYRIEVHAGGAKPMVRLGLTISIARSRPTGRSETIQRANRPWAVRVLTSRLISCRSRMLSVTRSSTSATLPPVSL